VLACLLADLTVVPGLAWTGVILMARCRSRVVKVPLARLLNCSGASDPELKILAV
jgi:hypothetical protein